MPKNLFYCIPFFSLHTVKENLKGVDMKRIISLVLCTHLLMGMEAPQQSLISWENYTAHLKNALTHEASEQAAAKRIPINRGPRLEHVLQNISLVTRKPGAGGKLVVLYVYEGNEPFRGAFENPVTDSYKELATLMMHFTQKRFEAMPEKASASIEIRQGGKPLAQEVVAISYAYGVLDPKQEVENQKNEKAALLADFIASLPQIFGLDTKLVVVAQGESTDIINRATHKAGTTLDTLLYFQAPIYEWEWKQGWTGGEYKYNEQRAPTNFEHLYHLYSKAGWTSNQYPERKFRQQAQVVRNQLRMPIKNVRVLKINNNSLDDFSNADFLNAKAIKNYQALIDQIDSYAINFDLIANVYDQNEPKSVPAVAINRFVMLKDNKLVAPYGSSLVGKEYVYDLIPLSPVILDSIKPAFSTEVQESIGQLINLTNIPATQGWASFVLGSLQGDIDRIKKQYDLVLKSPLYIFQVPAAAQPFARVITPTVKAEFEKVNKDFNISSDYALTQMQMGAFYLSNLLQGTLAASATATQEAYMRTIIAMIWYLYALALDKNQGFEEGTFVVEDANFVLYNFLLNYIKKFNPSIKGTLEDPKIHVSYNPFGYSRDSSHLNQELYRHYGIDVRFGARGSELPLLPADKRHILFGKVNQEKNLIFIKPENFGLYYLDGLIAHGLELGESKLRKAGVARKTDDDPTYRKERVPEQFLRDFDVALQQSGIPDTERNQLIALAKKLDGGIKTIYLDSLMGKPAIQALEQKYKVLYDNLPIRIGREVIITNEKLRALLHQ